ncbi:MAG: hypothetical protein E5V60_07815 [Mesorhizobium sp.]|nr:MAG: hypothetical protein EOR08_28275 [Mesorhizobium sp.]TIW67710.1 MAG: hypothetical protein E5V60_07815 [Mesorhizobium sp.]
MATTAYSKHYAREIDVEQLAWLLSGRQPDASEQVSEIDSKWSEWIRSDVQCSSCGRIGAHVVRSARSRGTQKVIRQSHFRFLGQDGNDAHHPFCEFYGEDDGVLSQPDGLVNLGSERSAETRLIRELVCKGIEQNLFDQSTIRAMRQWFFELKASSRFRMTVTPEQVEWARCLRRHAHYQRWTFHPAQAEMPGFDWAAAAKYQFTEEHLPLFELLRETPVEATHWRRAQELTIRHKDQEVFDLSALRPHYDAALTLCRFVAKNAGVKFSPTDPDSYRWKGPPVPLLALCGLSLFVSSWDMNAAIAMFAKLLRSPAPADLSRGNVIGLNPFHEYTPWRLVQVSADIASSSFDGQDYPGRLAAIEAKLREQHRLWKLQNP